MLQCNMNAGGKVVPLHGSDPRSSAGAPALGQAAWSAWRRWFDVWEGATARLAEQALRQPWVLEPAGAALTGAMKLKAAGDRMADAWCAVLGISTRTEQLRLRHELNLLHSRVLDLQEQLELRGEDTP